MKELNFYELNKRALEILAERYPAACFKAMVPQSQSDAFNAAFDKAMYEYNE